jgi:uncharacterized integral membrane protein (TIGR00697 family)
VLKTKKEIAFVMMSGIFITNAIVAELISAKEVDIGLFPIIAGIVPWPVVFLLTDVMNEYYGKQAVQRLSWITAGCIAFCFAVVYAAVQLPFSPTSWAKEEEFNKIFAGSLWIMIGSIVAFIVSQFVDVKMFWLMKKLTGNRFIWLRATGSTVISQLLDSYLVLFIGFFIPGKKTFDEIIYYGITGYLTKLVIAVALTPLIYLLHFGIKKMFGKNEAEKMVKESELNSFTK